MGELLDQFVCVRVVQMWGVDLSRFSFDGNLTWAVMFTNADGAVYGRYGSRFGRDATATISTAAFKAAMKAALELHAAYPSNAAALAGKRATAPSWPTPDELPGHAGRFRLGDTSRTGCIHCHWVDAGLMKSSWLVGDAVTDDMLWSYPSPELLGLSLDPTERATVTQVRPNSEGASAGLAPGDRILELSGQPMLSIADVAWVLHHAPAPGVVRARIMRGDRTVDLELTLPKDWRRRAEFTWSGGVWWLRPGIHSRDLSAEQRATAGLQENQLALSVLETHEEWGTVAMDPNTARYSNLKKGDVIVAIDGDGQHRTESEFIAWFWQNTRPGQKVTLTVLRDAERVLVDIHMPSPGSGKKKSR